MNQRHYTNCAHYSQIYTMVHDKKKLKINFIKAQTEKEIRTNKKNLIK